MIRLPDGELPIYPSCVSRAILLLSSLVVGLASCVGSSQEIVPIELTITPEATQQLKQNPRADVPVIVQLGSKRITITTVHLKGHGSFQPISGKPSFSIRSATADLFGRKKLLLNNSSQDHSFLKWKIASELFAKAGVPSPEIGFATVAMNGKKLGMYLVVEPTDKQFLKKHFTDPGGNLYEGANQDVTDVLDSDSSNADLDQKDRLQLASACLEPDLQKRWTRLNQALDMERFLSFMAVEVLVDHRDGYSMDRNNFRLYHDPISDKFVFLPHGLDLLFYSSDLSPSRHFSSLLASSILETPEGKAAYEARLHELAAQFYSDKSLIDRVDQLWNGIKSEAPADSEKSIGKLKAVLKARIESFRAKFG